jgi:hypothetical protein
VPSSISSSEDARAARIEPGQLGAQPYVRPLPEMRAGTAVVVGLVVFVMALAGWEFYWRAWGSEPAIRNSPGLWAMQRRRIDNGEGHKTVIVGSSRMLFDVQLPVWEQVGGERPIQLAIEGTSPLPVMEQLADDPDFTGRLVVGVAPDLFFTGFTYLSDKYELYPKETPSERVAQWLSMTLLEPWLAYYDEDFALMTVLKRQPWPVRGDLTPFLAVRKLSVSQADRNTHMWSKVENDPEYAALCQRIWAQDFGEVPFGSNEALQKKIAGEIDRAVKAVAALRARGVSIVFVRAPSDADYRAYEDRWFPRATTWDVLLQKTGVPGIHFDDYPAMQGLRLPEWSHLAAADARKYTAALQPLVEQAFAAQRKGD